MSFWSFAHGPHRPGIFKVLPRTNCGDCGQAACLAFATRVIKEGEDMKRCPHLSPAALALAGEVQSQQAAGVGKRRESVAIALEALQAKVAPLDLARVALGVGAIYGEQDGCPYVDLDYFGHRLRVFKDQVCYPEGVDGQSLGRDSALQLPCLPGDRGRHRRLDHLSEPAQFRVQDQDPEAPGGGTGGPLCR